MKTEIRKASSPKGEITIVRLTNDHGAYIEVSSLGAGLTAVAVPDRNGVIEDVLLGYSDPADYLYDGPCMGKTPGRFANRIAKGHFAIDGKNYTLPVNNGPNSLHGGPEGFQNQLWETHIIPGGVMFSRTSPDGEEGYPGNLKVRILYHWSENDVIQIHYQAETDAPTVVNLTNHSYWNLTGRHTSVLNHTLRLRASRYLPTDNTLIPTGELAEAVNTPMDFTKAKPLGIDINADFPALKFGKGYDSCWVVDGWKSRRFIADIARLEDPDSGRILEVGSTLPGVQIYTGNWLKGSPKGRNGEEYEDYDGVAIEMQAFPDSPNRTEFPTTELRPGDRYDEHIRFAFSTK